METLKSIKHKLQAYSSLPNPDCIAIGQHLLPEIISAIKELDDYKKKVKDDQEEVFFKMVEKLGENKSVMEMNINGDGYVFHVTKLQPKK